MNETNFMQLLEMSDERKIKAYMRLPKSKLAEMLLQANKIAEYWGEKVKTVNSIGLSNSSDQITINE